LHSHQQCLKGPCFTTSSTAFVVITHDYGNFNWGEIKYVLFGFGSLL
jgi:hypothetical protein